jgi:hydroxyacylglutathione hydrolase
MILEVFVVGMLQTNCYLVGDPNSRTAVVIDPGGGSARIATRLNQLGLTLAAIINTHGHFDHMSDAWALKEQAGGDIFLHRLDEPIMRQSMAGKRLWFLSGRKKVEMKIDRDLQGGDTLMCGSIALHVLETPGHTPGHVSLHIPTSDVVFVGDTLFSGSIGRTDLPGGSHGQLIRSVRTKIFPLAGNTGVYPGHGPKTTVEREQKSNPFF